MSGGEERLGEYVYRWSGISFPLGRDSLELGAFATVRPGDRVCDLGCGAGLLLLLCARRAARLELAGVELDRCAAGEARRNLADNGLAGTIWTGDLRAAAGGNFDLVISNPPWYPLGQKGGGARVEESAGLDQVCAAAHRLLRHGGRFALVHRPERLVDLLCALRGSGLEPKRLKFCRHDPERPPFAVLLEAVRGGRPGLTVET